MYGIVGFVAVLAACSVPTVIFAPDDDDGLPGGDPGSRTATVTISMGGAAAGSVSASDAALSCPGSCTATVSVGTAITLVATPGPGAVFGGWSGGCTRSDPTCTVTVTEDLAISGRFDVATFTVEVDLLGAGAGVVMSAGGVACPGVCTVSVAHNTAFELIAIPTSSSTFLGWGGACGGTGTCSVTVTGDTAITATFVLQQRTLQVTRAGTGTGTVTSNPAGISCGTDCAEAYNVGTIVSLAATPGPGATFSGWSGACSGIGACQVTMTVAASVIATFSFTARVAVSNFHSPGIHVFASSADGDAPPLTSIVGPATTFSQPRGITIDNNELFVVDQDLQAINVFATSANGDVAPVRIIRGPATGLTNAFTVAASGGELYIGQTGAILVFPRGANGNVPPSRTITGTGIGSYLAIVGGEIYALDRDPGRILVFAASAAGAAVPTRIIAGPSTGISSSLAILVQGGEIFVSDFSNNAIRVFPRLASGDVSPLRVISGNNTQLRFPEQMAVLSGELYVASGEAQSVLVFPVNANGNVAPTRRIAGPATRLISPAGLAIF